MHYTDSSALTVELQLLRTVSKLNIKSHKNKNNVIHLFGSLVSASVPVISVAECWAQTGTETYAWLKILVNSIDIHPFLWQTFQINRD